MVQRTLGNQMAERSIGLFSGQRKESNSEAPSFVLSNAYPG